MNPHDSDKLEASIHTVLRSVPDRPAPSALELRVLAEISRRAAQPWWRKSFAYWPTPVRSAFFVGSAIAAALFVSGLIVLGNNSGVARLGDGAAQSFAWIRSSGDLLTSISAFLRQTLDSIPRGWLYGGLAFVGASYALLGAIGATAYRTLSHGRRNP
jgi:hypothetical protein